MPKVTIEWTGGWRFLGEDSNGVQVVVDGEQQVGAKPSDLLPMALAACSGTDLVQVLGEGDATLHVLEVDARYTQQPAAPWSFQRIRLHYTIVADGVGEDEVAEAIRRSEEEMCSVAASLRGGVEITSTFELSSSG